jgi:hypothetical protein
VFIIEEKWNVKYVRAAAIKTTSTPLAQDATGRPRTRRAVPATVGPGIVQARSRTALQSAGPGRHRVVRSYCTDQLSVLRAYTGTRNPAG